jgi:septal ring factor EnvC (AmiA/AmiB activator)
MKTTPKNLEDRLIAFTRWVGSTQSVLLHTLFFTIALSLPLFGIDFQKVLLVVTTIVSLEAIYLSLFIQMSVNRTTEALAVVEHDIEELTEDVEEISEDVEEIGEDVEEIQKDIDEIQEDVEEIGEDVEEIQKDIDEIQEDVEELNEDEIK